MTDMTLTAAFPMRPDQVRDDRQIRLGAGGSSIEVLAAPAETDGAVSAYRWRMSPSSCGPSPHFHTTFSETFIVEEGEVDFFDGRAWRTLLPDQTAHAKTGVVHAIRKNHDEPATLLMILSPGVPREDYFAQIAHVKAQDMDRLHEAHDNHFVEDVDR
ncbi:cupin domain-containing protein [Nocardioides ungokensis]|uniref:cupin domain-containing protein n=1 Tax=Nocardioides ungokensis TaxID=1643322 RepID=UPI0015DFF4F8|nr:cupin domain-containing protein [Nocardioides ungokensis]